MEREVGGEARSEADRQGGQREPLSYCINVVHFHDANCSEHKLQTAWRYGNLALCYDQLVY